MKAYMTDVHHDPYLRELASVFGAPAAMVEARVILAESQPWRGDRHDSCREEGCPQYREAREALVESLSVFVGGR